MSVKKHNFQSLGKNIAPQVNFKGLKMFKYIIILFSFFVKAVYADASCVSCGSITNTITKNLSTNENVFGQVLLSTPVSSPPTQYRSTLGQRNQWWATYPGSSPPSSGSMQSTWTNFKIDDYISVGLSVNYSECRGVMYFPFNVVLLDNKDCKPLVGSTTLRTFLPVSFKSRILITKKMKGGVYSNHILVAESGVCEPINCASKQAVITKIYLKYNIVVPRNCVINAGQLVNIDFGEISTSAFTTAGARAEGVNPQSRTINMQCNGVQAQESLSMRIRADSASGNAILSSNKDVGFVMADATGKELTPNSVSSVIPFRLNSNGNANIPLKVWPISVTGKKPTEGVVTSRGYLRINFD